MSDPLKKPRWPCPPDMAAIVREKVPQVLRDFMSELMGKSVLSTWLICAFRFAAFENAAETSAAGGGSDKLSIGHKIDHLPIGTDIDDATGLNDPKR